MEDKGSRLWHMMLHNTKNAIFCNFAFFNCVTSEVQTSTCSVPMETHLANYVIKVQPGAFDSVFPSSESDRTPIIRQMHPGACFIIFRVGPSVCLIAPLLRHNIVLRPDLGLHSVCTLGKQLRSCREST